MEFNADEQRRTLAFGLIAVGLFFLLSNIFNINIGASTWPFFVIAPGAFFIYLAYSGDRDKAGFIYPGVVIAGTGAILLYQNMTSNWESWAYIWALYPVFVGLGMRFQGERMDNYRQAEYGKNLVKFGIIAFAIGFAFFEVILFGAFGSIAWVLIAAGVAILFMSGKNRAKNHDYHMSNGNGENTKAKVKNDETYPVI